MDLALFPKPQQFGLLKTPSGFTIRKVLCSRFRATAGFTMWGSQGGDGASEELSILTIIQGGKVIVRKIPALACLLASHFILFFHYNHYFIFCSYYFLGLRERLLCFMRAKRSFSMARRPTAKWVKSSLDPVKAFIFLLFVRFA